MKRKKFEREIPAVTVVAIMVVVFFLFLIWIVPLLIL
jgi:hypothetical protein